MLTVWMRTNLRKEYECKVKYYTDHLLMCKNGGFITLGHNEVAYVTVSLLSRVIKDVSKKTVLSPTPTGYDYLKASISSCRFW